MRVVVVGLGVQGRKRIDAAGADVIATVDPVVADAEYRTLEDVPADVYDAVLVCTPDAPKIALLTRALSAGKHVLVEKPLLAPDNAALERLASLAQETGAVCYTAYNHRFEPHFVRMCELLQAGTLGRLYALRLFYGNGTARLVRGSPWRDAGSGVLADLGSHLLDTLLFWLGDVHCGFTPAFVGRHENLSPDHVILMQDGPLPVTLEMMMVSWRNHFTADIFAERGSAHISSLCKWGPSSFTLRTRVLPSGRPPEETVTLVQSDPTWDLEYRHFKTLCETGGASNIANDIWINGVMRDIATQAGLPA